MRQYIYIIMAFVLFGSPKMWAQENTINKADKNFDNFAYIDARKIYLKVAEEGYLTDDLLKRLADSYYYTANYTQAAKWYGALYELGNKEADYLYKYALSLKSDRSYVASDQIMEEFLNLKGEDYRARLFLKERNYLEEIEAQSGRFEISSVWFNSKLSDFAPNFYQGRLVFSSNRVKRSARKMIHDWNEQPFLDIYGVAVGNEANKKGAQKFSKKINSKYHESTVVFTKDGLTMYFTRNNYTNKDYREDTEGTNRLKLYRAIRTGEGDKDWVIEELPFNSDEYSVAHPALSKNEQTLYFASDMPGGKGQSDLYKIAIQGDGFGEAISLGGDINTEGRETFPFLGEDGKLYFASDGHIGLGGLDLFVTEMNDFSKFGEVFNLGRPINSPNDDFTFVINKNGLGYFASNRKGGIGDDDIYSFKSTKPLITSDECRQSMEGRIRDEKTDVPIGNAKVYLLNSEGKVIDESVSNSDGTFIFEDLLCSKQYAIRSQKSEYSTSEKPFATGKRKGIVERTLRMKEGNDLGVALATPGVDLVKILGLNMIYFDLNKAFIRTDAKMELHKIIAVMKLYPTMKIDVRSHTDSRSRDLYNKNLSERRAKSTINYLVKVGGIDRSRLRGKGYGERQLLNKCSNGVPCEDYEHQINRRSEFIILSN